MIIISILCVQCKRVLFENVTRGTKGKMQFEPNSQFKDHEDHSWVIAAEWERQDL